MSRRSATRAAPSTCQARGVRPLTVSGLTSDGLRLVLRAGDELFELPLAEVPTARQPALPFGEPPPERSPTPREIQQRVRAGESSAEIAQKSGMPVEAVAKYEGPVLAEREYQATQARRALVDGRVVDELVEEHMARMAQDLALLAWDCWLLEPGRWHLVAKAGREMVRMRWDPAARKVHALDEPARQALRLGPVTEDALGAVLRPVQSRSYARQAEEPADARTADARAADARTPDARPADARPGTPPAPAVLRPRAVEPLGPPRPAPGEESGPRSLPASTARTGGQVRPGTATPAAQGRSAVKQPVPEAGGTRPAAVQQSFESAPLATGSAHPVGPAAAQPAAEGAHPVQSGAAQPAADGEATRTAAAEQAPGTKPGRSAEQSSGSEPEPSPTRADVSGSEPVPSPIPAEVLSDAELAAPAASPSSDADAAAAPRQPAGEPPATAPVRSADNPAPRPGEPRPARPRQGGIPRVEGGPRPRSGGSKGKRASVPAWGDIAAGVSGRGSHRVQPDEPPAR